MKILADKVQSVNALMSNQKWTAELDGDILFAGSDARRTEVIVIDNTDEALLDMAYIWGQEDATECNNRRGPEWFDGAALENYNEGYQAGLDLLLGLEGPSDELAFMDSVLTSLRSGATKPMVRLTKAQMLEIEEERIGASFCEAPYNR